MAIDSMDPFRIYISHRHEDYETVARLRDLLSLYGGLRVAIHVNEEIPSEENWRSSVGEKIARAELFLLLLTKPPDLSNDLNWSLFEAGLFSGAMESKKRMIVVLSPPDLDTLAPLRSIRHVAAVPDQMAQFLKELFGDTYLTGRDQPINSLLVADRNRLAELAGEICALLAPQRLGARMHANYLIFRIRGGLSEPIIPDDTEIEGGATSLQMFGLLGREQLRWRDIRQSLHGEKYWITELSYAIYAISNGYSAKPIKTILSSPEGKSFIPMIYRDEKISSGVELFHVLFVPTDVTPVDPTLVFVVSAFRNEMEPMYEAVSLAVKSFNFSAKRVKDVVGDYRITDKVLEMIRKAKYVVVDLTYERPNVYFELGYARGLGKTVITTVRRGTVVHFDVKDWTYIEYDDSRVLERELTKRLEADASARQE